jgi:pre-mRNA branch site protein p14
VTERLVVDMAASRITGQDRHIRLAPEVNRVLYVRNLPYDISDEDMYGIFGRYGAIRQVRVGDTQQTKGTAFVVYEDIYDARNAQVKLSGFNLQNRYLVVTFHQESKRATKMSIEEQQEELRQMQRAEAK